MLGKIIKYEWRATWKVNALLLGIFWASVLVMQLISFLPWNRVSEDVTIQLLFLVGMLLYGVILVINIGVPLYLTIRYYKSMYSNEGYLTHTLPTTGNELYFGKWIQFIIWKVIVGVSIFLGVSMFVTVAIRVLGEPITMWEVWRRVADFIVELGDGAEWYVVIALVFVSCVVTLINSSLKCLGVVNIGQLWKKNKVGGAILIYLGIFVLEKILSYIIGIELIFFGDMFESVYSYWNLQVILGIVLQLVIGTVMLLSSIYIVNKKVNLE